MTAALNYLTARPTLELLLALQGLEAPSVTPAEALPLFVDFLELPQDEYMSDAGFQTTFASEGPGVGLLTLTWAARYRIPDLNPEYNFPPSYRTVGLRWTYILPIPLQFEPKDIWVGDYPTLQAFAAAVQESTEWEAVGTARTEECDAFGEDE